MDKLKFISAGMIISGSLSFFTGIAIPMKEFAQYGLHFAIAGLVGYALTLFLATKTRTGKKPHPG